MGRFLEPIGPGAGVGVDFSADGVLLVRWASANFDFFGCFFAFLVRFLPVFVPYFALFPSMSCAYLYVYNFPRTRVTLPAQGGQASPRPGHRRVNFHRLPAGLGRRRGFGPQDGPKVGGQVGERGSFGGGKPSHFKRGRPGRPKRSKNATDVVGAGSPREMAEKGAHLAPRCPALRSPLRRAEQWRRTAWCGAAPEMDDGLPSRVTCGDLRLRIVEASRTVSADRVWQVFLAGVTTASAARPGPSRPRAPGTSSNWTQTATATTRIPARRRWTRTAPTTSRTRSLTKPPGPPSPKAEARPPGPIPLIAPAAT